MPDLLDFLEAGTDLPDRMMFIGQPTMVSDKAVQNISPRFDYLVPLRTPQDASQGSGVLGTRNMYLVRSLASWAPFLALLRNDKDSGAVVVTEAPKGDADFKKVRSLFSRTGKVYTLTTPSTDRTKSKYVQFFMMRWRLPRKTVADILERVMFSPVGLYEIDLVFSAFQSKLGDVRNYAADLVPFVGLSDPHATLVQDIIASRGTQGGVTGDVAVSALSRLAAFINTMEVVKREIVNGTAPHPKTLSLASEIPVFRILEVMPWEKSYGFDRIRECRDLLEFGFNNSHRPDVLKVIGEIW